MNRGEYEMEIQTSSIFKMEDVNTIIKLPLSEAKKFALDVINSDVHAKLVTKNKARLAIAKANTSQKIAFAMAGWILAHPSEGLKVLK